MRATGRGKLRTFFAPKSISNKCSIAWRSTLKVCSPQRHASGGATNSSCPGGDSPTDLVSATLLKLLAPFGTSVTSSPTKGPPTTAKVLAYFHKVLERDFLDLVQSKDRNALETSVYPDDERTAGDLSESPSIRGPSSFSEPEDDPELLEILQFQLEPAGYNTVSSQDSTKRLKHTTRRPFI